MTDRTAPSTGDAEKSALRNEMRALRRALADRDQRSVDLWRHVIGVPAMVVAETVLVFATVPGEPDTAELLAWCAATGRLAAVPEAEVDPQWPDVVVVPGLAFTDQGDRLGQGGGWYDRYLAEVRADCTTVGVCFAEQVVGNVPVEAHDICMDHVVTDQGVLR